MNMRTPITLICGFAVAVAAQAANPVDTTKKASDLARVFRAGRFNGDQTNGVRYPR